MEFQFRNLKTEIRFTIAFGSKKNIFTVHDIHDIMNFNDTKMCQGKDVFERMNYLYQASRFIVGSSEAAASHYGNIMVSCAKKAVLRMEPEIKRTICKNCQSPLIPGETARIRLVSKPMKAIKWTCLICETVRKIPSKKGYKLWVNEADSLLQMYDYTPAENSPFTSPNKLSSQSTEKSRCHELNICEKQPDKCSGESESISTKEHKT